MLAARLDPSRFETHLLAGRVPPGEGDMTYFAEQHHVTPEIIPELSREIRPRQDFEAFRYILAHLREFQPHIVHTHTAKAGALGRMAARVYNARRPGSAPRARVVHTYHGHVLHSYFGGFRTAVFRRVERYLARHTDALIALSPELRRELAYDFHVGVPEQYHDIPLGFDLEPFLKIQGREGSFRKSLGVTPETILVTIVGRLTAIKNHAMLMAAASKLERRHWALVRFAVVGDGELRAELEADAHARGFADKFFFTGWRQDMPSVYADSDVVVLCSKNEGTPVTLIEAMASGRAVVSTDVGGVKDIVTDGKTGILVAPHRVDRLAIAIGQLADIPEIRNRLAQNARRSVATRFSVDRLVEDITRLYGELL